MKRTDIQFFANEVSTCSGCGKSVFIEVEIHSISTHAPLSELDDELTRRGWVREGFNLYCPSCAAQLVKQYISSSTKQ